MSEYSWASGVSSGGSSAIGGTRGVEDLEDSSDVVDKRLDPGPRLNSRTLTVSDGSAGIFRWISGFALFFLDAGGMAVSGKGTMPLQYAEQGIYILDTH